MAAYLWLAVFTGRSGLSGHGAKAHLKNVTVTAVSCRQLKEANPFGYYPESIICNIHWFSEVALVCFIRRLGGVVIFRHVIAILHSS